MNPTKILVRFLVALFAVFFLTATFLFVIDFVPEAPEATTKPEAPEAELVSEVPTRVVIKDIGVDTLITNPSSLDIGVLDQALLAGAVRYPGSALLGERAPVFLFGHQSYLPVVRNQAYKAFNDLQKLEAGDTIEVYGEGAVHMYAVTAVSLTEASDALIPLGSDDPELYLSTCNSFGNPGERWVVRATFVSRTLL